jgi:FlaA1/EpsC-like NDP-sugar epimerase
MKVLVIGAGRLGAQVISQLKKNERITVITADIHDRPEAVKKGIIDKIDLKVHITPLNAAEIVEKVKPDLVLLARTVDDWEEGDVPMGTEFVMGMERELTRMGVPVLPISCRVFGNIC